MNLGLGVVRRLTSDLRLRNLQVRIKAGSKVFTILWMDLCRFNEPVTTCKGPTYFARLKLPFAGSISL